MKKKIFKVMKVILALLLAIIVVGIIWNFVCKKLERSQIQDAYGTGVKVDGKTMVVDCIGEEGNPVIVLLPGLGSPSPILEFKPLAERLSENYRVVTVEPFGYGLSDLTDTERSIENIVDELHQCLNALGYENYYLMAHSISGIYSLYYANEYSDEVLGFIGIDSSVPRQDEDEPFDTVKLNLLAAYLSKAQNGLGISRILSVGNPQKAIYADTTYLYSVEELRVFRALAIDISYNKTVMNELKMTSSNLDIVREMKFPETIPVLSFVSIQNCEIFPTWEQLHRDVIQNTENSTVVLLDGGHYLHIDCLEDIIDQTSHWIIP